MTDKIEQPVLPNRVLLLIMALIIMMMYIMFAAVDEERAKHTRLYGLTYMNVAAQIELCEKLLPRHQKCAVTSITIAPEVTE